MLKSTDDEIIHLFAEILTEARMPIPATCPWCQKEIDYCVCGEECPVGS